MATNRQRLGLSVEVDHMSKVKDLAAEHGTTPGMVARAMIGYALTCMRNADTADEVRAAIQHEVDQETARRVQVGTAVMAARWGREAQS